MSGAAECAREQNRREIILAENARLREAALRAENARLRAALEQIASCESHFPGDVVSVARAALAGEVKP